MKVRYAAYGSNLHPLRLRQRAPSAILVGTAFIGDHDLLFHKRSRDASGKCNLRPGSKGAFVAVYEMNARDKSALDEIEGAGAGYEVVDLLVPAFGRCTSYMAAHTHVDEMLKPYDWYQELVILGCRRLEWPADYVARVEAISAIPDPHQLRREHNRRIVDMLRRDAAAPAT